MLFGETNSTRMQVGMTHLLIFCSGCMLKISVHIHAEGNRLQLLEVIGRGSFGTVHVAAWRGSLIAAKVVPVQVSEAAPLAAEIDILRYVLLSDKINVQKRCPIIITVSYSIQI